MGRLISTPPCVPSFTVLGKRVNFITDNNAKYYYKLKVNDRLSTQSEFLKLTATLGAGLGTAQSVQGLNYVFDGRGSVHGRISFSFHYNIHTFPQGSRILLPKGHTDFSRE
jgi:hypothetical protein